MADINIRDLSIGDWVEIDGEPAKALCLRIAGGHIFKGISGQMYRCCGGMDFKPIPLTPEILEKNGFEKGEIYEGNSSIVFTNGNIIISWYKNAMWCRLRIYNALGDTELCSAIVHNVHQLQHALRLAGVGKEIEV